jgi:hypothetical protein
MNLPKYCRFCEVPIDKKHPKLNNLTAQLLQYHYLDEFYFYFSKPINEIIDQTRSPESLAFREMQIQITRPKLGFCYYNKKDFGHTLVKQKLKQNRAYKPLLVDSSCFKILQKNEARKKQVVKRGLEDVDEQKRFNRRRQQLPLRDDNMLTGKNGFVDADSFDSNVFDIYNPSFSSMREVEVPEIENPLSTTKVRELSSEIIDPSKHLSKPKVQIPLLCFNNKLKGVRLREECSNSSDPNKPKLKYGTTGTGEQTISRAGIGNSDNQSTQFSINCNWNTNRRKQVLESAKRSGTAATIIPVNSNTLTKLSTSPKLFKKKKQTTDSTIKEKKVLKKSRDGGESKPKLAATNSLFNSRSWKLIKSWDQLFANHPRNIATENTAKSQHQKKMRHEAEIAEVSSGKGLQNSHESLKGVSVVGLKLSNRKLALSPRLATERAPSARDQGPAFSSFKDKCSLRENRLCMIKRLHKPLWISIGQAQAQKDNRVLLDQNYTLNTKSKSRSKEKTHSRIKDSSHKGNSREKDHLLMDTALLSKNHFLTSRTTRPKGAKSTIRNTTEKKPLEQSATGNSNIVINHQAAAFSGPNIQWCKTQASDLRGYILEELINARKSKGLGTELKDLSRDRKRPDSKNISKALKSNRKNTSRNKD